MAIDWENMTTDEQLKRVALLLYRLLNMVRVMPVPELCESPYGMGPTIVWEEYCCIEDAKENDKRIREIADEWKASGLFWILPLTMTADDLGWLSLDEEAADGHDTAESTK